MRRPLLLAAAIALTGGSIGVIAYSERRPEPRLVTQQLSTTDVALPSMPPMRTNGPTAPTSTPPPPPPDQGLAVRDVEAGPAERPGIIRETAPRIAYSYGYRFRVPGAALGGLQERHLQLCLQLGEMRCRVVSMRRSEARAGPPPRDHGYGGGAPAEQPGAALELQVATPLAHEFGRSLGAAAGAAGGETVDRQIAAEDLSRQMVDSEARIRTRETLVRRLSALLETRSGNIQQAVEAERAINQAQEELDAARIWLAEMRGRVTMSRIAIAYEAAAGAAVTADPERSPLARSIAQIAALTGKSIAALLLVFGVMLPWGAILLLIVLATRWHRRRMERDVAASQPL